MNLNFNLKTTSETQITHLYPPRIAFANCRHKLCKLYLIWNKLVVVVVERACRNNSNSYTVKGIVSQLWRALLCESIFHKGFVTSFCSSTGYFIYVKNSVDFIYCYQFLNLLNAFTIYVYDAPRISLCLPPIDIKSLDKTNLESAARSLSRWKTMSSAPHHELSLSELGLKRWSGKENGSANSKRKCIKGTGNNQFKLSGQ